MIYDNFISREGKQDLRQEWVAGKVDNRDVMVVIYIIFMYLLQREKIK